MIGGNVLKIFITTLHITALYFPNKFTEEKYDVKIAVIAAKIVANNAISRLTNNSLNIFPK